jgi:hypothetical protein
MGYYIISTLLHLINIGMFREIITSSITLANSGTVIGGNIAPAVSGLTVNGDVSATGTIYSKVLIIGGVSATGSTLSSALVSFPTPDTVPGLKINDVLKYQETTPGVSAWTSGRVFVEELSASGALKEGALVTYSKADEGFVAKDPEKNISFESSYIKKLGKCAYLGVNTSGIAAVTTDERIIAWGYLPTMIGGSTDAAKNIRIPFWNNYNGYLSGDLYKPYGGDFFDLVANKNESSESKKIYTISDLYWTSNGAMALVSATDEIGGDIWVGGVNSKGTVVAGANPRGLVKTKHNNYIITNEVGANAMVQTGGIYKLNPQKDIGAIQKYNAGVSRDIIPDITTNTDILSDTDYFYVSDAATVKRINAYGELLSSYTGAPSAFSTPSGLSIVVSTSGLSNQIDRDLIYVCDINRIKVYDITDTKFTFLSAIGTGVSWTGTAPVDGSTDDLTKPQFRNLRYIASDPNQKNCLYVTDENILRRIWRKDNGHWKVSTISNATGTNFLSGFIRLNNPTGVFIKPQGLKVTSTGSTLYVADSAANVISEVTISSNDENNFQGESKKYVDTTYKTVARFNNPYAMTKDKDGNIYIADYGNHIIRKIAYDQTTNTYGDVAKFAGSGVAGLQGGALLQSRFNNPAGITYVYDPGTDEESLYVTNYSSHAISKINLVTNDVTVYFTKGSGRVDGDQTTAQFYNPIGIEYAKFDSRKYLFVADTMSSKSKRGNIRQIDITSANSFSTTTIIGRSEVGSSLSNNVLGTSAYCVDQFRNLCYDTVENYLYFTNGPAIQKYNMASKKVYTAAGSLPKGDISGQALFSKFNSYILSMTISGDSMFVADASVNKIKKISNFRTPAAATISLFAGTGKAGFTNTLATNSQFTSPNYIIKNINNDLLVCENHNIRRIYISSGTAYVKKIDGDDSASGSLDTKIATNTYNFCGLDLDKENNLSFTDLNTDTIGQVVEKKVNILRRMTAGSLGIGEGSNKRTGGFIKVLAVDEATGNIPKFKRIQFSSSDVTAMLFAALDIEDSLWIWGNSVDGAFGTGQINTIGPTKLYQFEKNIKDFQITCSASGVSLISLITKDGKLFSAGDNSTCQLGRNVSTTEPVSSSFKTFKQCLRKDGSSYVGIDDAEKIIVSNETGYKNNLYIDRTGSVWSCGSKDTGLLGTNADAVNRAYFDKIDGVSDVTYLLGGAFNNDSSRGYKNHTVFALKNDGTLYSWGSNLSGYCLINDASNNLVYTPSQCYNFETQDVVRNATAIYCNDNALGLMLAYLDSNNDLYLGGYSTEADIPDGNSYIPYFRKYNMRNISPDIILIYSNAIVRRSNGTIYEVSNIGAKKLF